MKIVFIGTVEFSRKMLEKLIELKAEIVGVCTKKTSMFNNDYEDLEPLCKYNQIPIRFTNDINSQASYNWIKSLRPDVIFCLGWSSLLKKNILSLAPMGVLGFHPTKLPYNRGRHPLIWTLILELKKSATTFFFMNQGADSGDIVSQREFEISINDDARDLYDKVVNNSLKQLEEIFPKLKNKTFETTKQNHELANTWRKRNKIDGKIDFRMTSKAIYNLVKALSEPYIGAHIEFKEKEIKVWKVKIIKTKKENNIESGKVLDVNNRNILVKTYDGCIEIVNHEFNELPNIGDYL